MKSRMLKIISLNISLIIIFFGYYFLNHFFNFTINCPFHYFTGYYCPGCGVTRLLFYLIQGKIKKAFFSNCLVFILLPFIFFYIFYKQYLYIFDKKDKILSKIPNYVYYLIIIITILFGILRNLEPFSFLKP